MKKGIVAALFLITLFLPILSAQLINPGSTDASGAEKNNFSAIDEIYLKTSSACTRSKAINLYIVEDKKEWNNLDKLVDARGTSQNITTNADATISLVKIWEKPKAGKYDIILDCNNNGLYDADPILEPIDSFEETGFEVVSRAGTGKVSLGENTPKALTWQYDKEFPNLINEILQLKLEGEGEDIILKNITLKVFGIGNYSESIEKIEIYSDLNNNGKKDEQENKIGDVVYKEGELTSELEYTLKENVSTSILIVYAMKQEAKEVEIGIDVLSVSGKGLNSNELIEFSSLPIRSSTRKILQAKACLGILTLDFEPGIAEPKEKVKAKMENLTGCENLVINVQPSLCSVKDLTDCSCNSTSTGCNCEFNAAEINKTYWACIDKNNDADFLDYGESAIKTLVVSEKIEVKITGQAIENITEVSKIEIPGNNRLFIIVEITLVLILIVLFLILITLSKTRKTPKEAKTPKETKS